MICDGENYNDDDNYYYIVKNYNDDDNYYYNYNYTLTSRNPTK